MKKNILIIGGTKFIGSLLVDLFLSEEANVYIFSRAAPKQKNVTFIRGDRNNPSDLKKLQVALGATHFDCVYDMCCYEPVQVRPLFGVIKDCTERIVFFSSAAVYARTDVYPLVEASPLGENNSFGNYGTNKAQAEHLYTGLAKKRGVQLTIFRPHYILGVKDYFLRHQYFYSRIEKGQAIPVPGNGQSLVQFAYAPEVASLFYSVPFSHNLDAEILNVASTQMLTLDGVAAAFAASMGQQADISHIDYGAAGLDEKNFYDDLFPLPNLNLVLDTERARKVYGYPASDISSYINNLCDDWKNVKSDYEQVLSKFDTKL